MLKPLQTGSRPRGDEAALLLGFIKQYQQAAARAASELRAAFAVEDLLRAWRDKRIETSGRLTTPTAAGQFEFHGVGCRLQLAGAVVDVEFGPAGRCDGFDVWRLDLFAQDNASLRAPFQNRQQLADAFDGLVDASTIVCPRWEPSPHLYYLAESIG